MSIRLITCFQLALFWFGMCSDAHFNPVVNQVAAKWRKCIVKIKKEIETNVKLHRTFNTFSLSTGSSTIRKC